MSIAGICGEPEGRYMEKVFSGLVGARGAIRRIDRDAIRTVAFYADAAQDSAEDREPDACSEIKDCVGKVAREVWI